MPGARLRLQQTAAALPLGGAAALLQRTAAVVLLPGKTVVAPNRVGTWKEQPWQGAVGSLGTA